MPSRPSLPQRVSQSFRVIKELDLSHRYETVAGTVVVVLLLAVVVSVAVASGWLTGGGRPFPVVADFPSAGGLNGGDPVVVTGVPVGRVRRIELIEPGRVRVSMAIDRDQRPRRDAHFEIRAMNMLGDVAVDYRPGTDSVVPDEGTVFAGRPARTLADYSVELKEQAAELAVSAREFLRQDFAAELVAARQATARAQQAIMGLRGGEPVDALTEALANGEGLLQSLDSLVAQVPLDTVRARLAALGERGQELMAGVSETQARLADIQARMKRGEGNIGMAMKDSALKRELDATRRSLDDLLFKYTGRRPAGRRAGGPAGTDSTR